MKIAARLRLPVWENPLRNYLCALKGQGKRPCGEKDNFHPEGPLKSTDNFA
jgi:hypothetical protein